MDQLPVLQDANQYLLPGLFVLQSSVVIEVTG